MDYLERLSAEDFLGKPTDLLTEAAIRFLFAFKTRLAMVPMQDLLALGADARMNTPALVSEENCSWRLSPAALTDDLAVALKKT